ncbi:hypothetical protein, partial [Massilibacteroides sp.]|uniref:hypothetical protein n=1 Tax=Massilibacteroides sp. TaxID=2034766 RepID=UPI002619AFA1
KETLIQIATGISEAQEELQETDCAINPREIKSKERDYAIMKNTRYNIQTIDFEIALSESSSSENKGGIGVALGAVGLAGGKTSNNENISNTKIAFSIPVVLPHVDNENTPVTISFTTKVKRSRRFD